MKLYTPDEIALFLTGTVTEDLDEKGVKQALEDWDEHMQAGEFEVGREEGQMSPEARAYLDDAITKWRAIRDGKEPVPDGLKSLAVEIEDNPGDADRSGRSLATLYIDAFQSVRASLLGELLP